jgi:hypothetical protein
MKIHHPHAIASTKTTLAAAHSYRRCDDPDRNNDCPDRTCVHREEVAESACESPKNTPEQEVGCRAIVAVEDRTARLDLLDVAQSGDGVL